MVRGLFCCTVTEIVLEADTCCGVIEYSENRHLRLGGVVHLNKLSASSRLLVAGPLK